MSELTLEMKGAPAVVLGIPCEAGNIYQNQRGGIVLVVAVRGHQAYYLTFDAAGNCINSGQGGLHYFAGKRCVGTTTLPRLDVGWGNPELV